MQEFIFPKHLKCPLGSQELRVPKELSYFSPISVMLLFHYLVYGVDAVVGRLRACHSFGQCSSNCGLWSLRGTVKGTKKNRERLPSLAFYEAVCICT